MGNNPSGSREVAGKKDFQEWPIDRVKLAFRRAQHLLVPMPKPEHPDQVTTTRPEPISSASKLVDDDNARPSSTLDSEHSAEATHTGSAPPNGRVHMAAGSAGTATHTEALARWNAWVDAFHRALKAVTRRQFWEVQPQRSVSHRLPCAGHHTRCAASDFHGLRHGEIHYQHWHNATTIRAPHQVGDPVDGLIPCCRRDRRVCAAEEHGHVWRSAQAPS